MSSSPSAYDGVTKSFHWLMALLIIGLWCVGLSLDEIPRGDFRATLIGLHKALGSVVLLLVVLRLAWRATHPAPALPDTMPRLEALGAKLGHVALYVLMIALPLDGILMSQTGGRDVSVFGLILPTLMAKDQAWNSVFKEGHETLAWILAALVAIHFLAALRHHVVLKDGVLSRMLPGRA